MEENTTLQITACSGCDGFWAAIPAVRELVNLQEDQLEGLLGKTVVEELTRGSSAVRQCPTCKVEMANYQYRQDSGLWLDACEQGHGIWFDPGELDIMRDIAWSDYQAKRTQESSKVSIDPDRSDIAIKIGLYFTAAKQELALLLVPRNGLTHPIWRDPGLHLQAIKAATFLLLGQMPTPEEIQTLTESAQSFIVDFQNILQLYEDLEVAKNNRHTAEEFEVDYFTYICFSYAVSSAISRSDVSRPETMTCLRLLATHFEEVKGELREQVSEHLANIHSKQEVMVEKGLDSVDSLSGEQLYEKAFQLDPTKQQDLIRGCFEKAAAKGIADAKLEYARCLWHGFGVIEEDKERAFELLGEAAVEGCSFAFRPFAAILEATGDLDEAEHWVKLGLEGDDPDGHWHMSQACINFKREDEEEAFRWHTLGAERGNYRSMRELAVFYLNGQGTEKDEAQGAQWMQRAAEAGSRKAAFTLGAYYANGDRGFPQDWEKSVQSYKDACYLGEARAAKVLCQMYRQGSGVSASQSRALWYQQVCEVLEDDQHSDALAPELHCPRNQSRLTRASKNVYESLLPRLSALSPGTSETETADLCRYFQAIVYELTRKQFGRWPVESWSEPEFRERVASLRVQEPDLVTVAQGKTLLEKRLPPDSPILAELDSLLSAGFWAIEKAYFTRTED